MSSESQRRYVWVGAAVLVVGIGLAWLMRPGASQPAPQGVMVYAAASLRDVMHDVGSAFAIENGAATERVHFNIAGSNVLAQQIVAAAQADIFISANADWIDHVEKAGRVVDGTRKDILSNRLVVVAHESTDWKIDEPADLGRLPFEHLSVGNPDAVPAGRYARQFLEGTAYANETLWDGVSDRVAPAPDVRAALALVEADPSVLGIVYRTDATASDDVRILYEIPDSEVPPVRYAVARIYRPDASDQAEAFYEFLLSAKAQELFAERGFVPIKQDPPGP